MTCQLFKLWLITYASEYLCFYSCIQISLLSVHLQLHWIDSLYFFIHSSILPSSLFLLSLTLSIHPYTPGPIHPFTYSSDDTVYSHPTISKMMNEQMFFAVKHGGECININSMHALITLRRRWESHPSRVFPALTDAAKRTPAVSWISDSVIVYNDGKSVTRNSSEIFNRYQELFPWINI